MKRVAFIFTHAPHGTASGREGLDALLATSAWTEELGVFFISDGVLQLLPNQKPEKILSRHYSAAFRLLSLYGIQQCYLCFSSLEERGLSQVTNWLLDVTVLSVKAFRRKLVNYNSVVTF